MSSLFYTVLFGYLPLAALLVVALLTASTYLTLTSQRRNLSINTFSPILASLLFLLFIDSAAQAQSSLFTAKAAAKADGVRQRQVSNLRERSDVGAELSLDTVDGILTASQVQRETFGAYGGFLYLVELQDALDVRGVDEISESTITERLVAYQTAKTFVELFKDTPLDDYYRNVVRSLRELRDATTVQVTSQQKGGVDLVHGAEGDARRLLEFKVHANVRDGLEPRLYLYETFTLRYSPFTKQALLEFEHNF
jgi:hypothetical protein